MRMNIEKYSTITLGFLQATGLVLYIGLVAVLMSNSGFAASGVILGGIIVLLLFVLSATICALLVLGRPAVLFWEKRYKDAFFLIVYTLLFGLFYLVLLNVLNGIISDFRS